MSDMNSELSSKEQRQAAEAALHCIMYLWILVCCTGIFVANLYGVSAWWWWVIIPAALPVSCIMGGLSLRYLRSRMKVLPELPPEPEEPVVVRVELPEKLSSAGIPEKADKTLVKIMIVLLVIAEVIGLSYAATEDLDIPGYCFFAVFSGMAATVASVFLFMIYKKWYEEKKSSPLRQRSAEKATALDVAMKGVAFLIAFIPMFVITVTLVIFGGCMFHQEFSETGEGVVIAVGESRGGYTLTFANGETLGLTSFGPERPKPGDHFEKLFRSFRYLVNGKNIASRDRVLAFFTPAKILPVPWLIGLMIGIILFQWLFFALYRNSFFCIWRISDIFKSRLRAPPPRHPFMRLERYLCLTPMPLMLALFLFYYFMMDRWM